MGEGEGKGEGGASASVSEALSRLCVPCLARRSQHPPTTPCSLRSGTKCLPWAPSLFRSVQDIYYMYTEYVRSTK